MTCEGCIHESEDRTKAPCEPCMASVLNGGERINYEAKPPETSRVILHFVDMHEGCKTIHGVLNYRLQGEWLVIEADKTIYYKTDEISHFEVE